MCAPLFITKMVSAFADGFDKRGRGGACVSARVALQGRIHHLFPSRMMRVFLVWKRRCADVRAGTQAPPLRFRLGELRANG